MDLTDYVKKCCAIQTGATMLKKVAKLVMIVLNCDSDDLRKYGDKMFHWYKFEADDMYDFPYGPDFSYWVTSKEGEPFECHICAGRIRGDWNLREGMLITVCAQAKFKSHKTVNESGDFDNPERLSSFQYPTNVDCGILKYYGLPSITDYRNGSLTVGHCHWVMWAKKHDESMNVREMHDMNFYMHAFGCRTFKHAHVHLMDKNMYVFLRMGEGVYVMSVFMMRVLSGAFLAYRKMIRYGGYKPLKGQLADFMLPCKEVFDQINSNLDRGIARDVVRVVLKAYGFWFAIINGVNVHFCRTSINMSLEATWQAFYTTVKSRRNAKILDSMLVMLSASVTEWPNGPQLPGIIDSLKFLDLTRE
jgi:hypothetical protein